MLLAILMQAGLRRIPAGSWAGRRRPSGRRRRGPWRGAAALALPAGALAALAIGLAAFSSADPARAAVAIYRPNQVVTFKGSGSGHGVGLSQWGAKGRAQQGQSAAQILAAYYQGTQLAQRPTESIQVRVLIDENYLPPARDGSFISSNKLPGDVFGLGGLWAIEGATGPLQPGTRMTLMANPGGKGHHVFLFDPAGNAMINFPFPGALKLIPLQPETRIQVYYKYTRPVPDSGGASFYDIYRGVIWIRQNSQGRIDTVNELNIEGYLRGVVPAEMPSHWPREALMAQSIAARTYALSSLNPGHPTYDMDDTTFFQVYEGVNREHPATSEAVDATRNTVVAFADQPIRAYYFSSGGGFTENVEDVFGDETLPYLRGFRDADGNGRAYDAEAPLTNWVTKEFPMRVLEDMLNVKPDTQVGQLFSIDLSDKSHSGLVRTVLVSGSGGTRRLPGGRFQALFNRLTPGELGAIESTRFDIEYRYPLTRPVPALNLPGRQSIYLAETGHNVIFGFKKYFETRGGAAVFGLPLTEEFQENGLTVQYFERARFEFHPELIGTPYEVQLGLLGDELTLGQRPFPGVDPFQSELDHRYFHETGHAVNFAFLKFWEEEGGLDAFGYPISEELIENGVTVQYFQRARFEYRPELGGPFGVAKGKLGE